MFWLHVAPIFALSTRFENLTTKNVLFSSAICDDYMIYGWRCTTCIMKRTQQKFKFFDCWLKRMYKNASPVSCNRMKSFRWKPYPRTTKTVFSFTFWWHWSKTENGERKKHNETYHMHQVSEADARIISLIHFKDKLKVIKSNAVVLYENAWNWASPSCYQINWNQMRTISTEWNWVISNRLVGRRTEERKKIKIMTWISLNTFSFY